MYMHMPAESISNTKACCRGLCIITDIVVMGPILLALLIPEAFWVTLLITASTSATEGCKQDSNGCSFLWGCSQGNLQGGGLLSHPVIG